MEVPLALDHLVISVLGLLLGAGVGIALGYLASEILGHSRPASRPPGALSLLVPWRSVLAAPFMFCLLPLTAVRWLGIGTKAGIAAVAMSILPLAAVATNQARRGTAGTHSSERLVSSLRSLAVLSVLLTSCYGMLGAGGLGYIASQTLSVLAYGGVMRAWGLALLIAFALDLVLGGVEIGITTSQGRRARLANTEAG
jgi:hypothetical protein